MVPRTCPSKSAGGQRTEHGPAFELQTDVLTELEEGKIEAVDVNLDGALLGLGNDAGDGDARLQETAVLACEDALHNAGARRADLERHLAGDLSVEAGQPAFGVGEVFAGAGFGDAHLLDVEVGRELLLQEFLLAVAVLDDQLDGESERFDFLDEGFALAIEALEDVGVVVGHAGQKIAFLDAIAFAHEPLLDAAIEVRGDDLQALCGIKGDDAAIADGGLLPWDEKGSGRDREER